MIDNDKNTLDSSIRYLKGVGEAREKLFNKLGIATLRDLVGFFPRDYEDRTVFKKINSLFLGESVCVQALVAAAPRLSHIRRGLSLVKFNAVDETGSLEITFFNAPFVKDSIKQGETYIFYGKISGTLLRPEMTNPVFERTNAMCVTVATGDGSWWSNSVTKNDYQEPSPLVTGCIVPIYPLTAKLTQKAIATAVRSALNKCSDELPDVLPDEIASQYKLARARYAYFNIHFPESFKDLDIARRRLIFEELFVLTSAMKLMREQRGSISGKALPSPNINEFYKTLPFTPTGAQKRAIDDVISDISSGKLMNRLIQGDVGSGKTLVAAASAWVVWRGGAQTAFMVPTEILAKQHFASLSELLEPIGMHVGLLTGSMTAKGKRETYAKLGSGEIDLIIGTHALISEGVGFSNLALVITDEQHRFGVAQRTMLAEKGDNPHVLVMSATPIPRTLALIIYGDLSVSIIDEMPPGRTAVETHIIGEKHRERAYGFVRKLVGEGRQVFIICPIVENVSQDGMSEGGADINMQSSVKSVKEYYETLRTKVFPDLKIALVHGKMPTKEKDAAMTAFASGNADILVATTVVEVGVDVPNAALMLIENADRFGLSQLHQLRGRVGRGKHKSFCVLVKTVTAATGDGSSWSFSVTKNSHQEPSPVATDRLHIMKSTGDGFKIAEEDLKLRGPGDFFGERQHGLPELKIANLMTDMIVLREAEQAAQETLRCDPTLTLPEHKQLSEQIKRMFGNVSIS